MCIVQGLAGFKVVLSNTAPVLNTAVDPATYTDCGAAYGGSLDADNAQTISVECDTTVGQTFQFVIILGSLTLPAELCMDEVEVYARGEYAIM